MREVKTLLKNKKREMTLILVSAMILALFFSGYSMGKETSSINMKANSKIAEPILIVEKSPVIEMQGKKEREYYDFKVKNYKETGEVTQIDLEYSIEILFPIEDSISFKLYKNDQEILLENNRTTNMKLKREKIQEDDYQLEIIYEKAKNRSNKDIIQEIQLRVHSEQIKI